MFDALRDRKTNKKDEAVETSDTNETFQSDTASDTAIESPLTEGTDLPSVESTPAEPEEQFASPSTASHVSKPTVAEQIKQIRRNVDRPPEFTSFEEPEPEPEAPNRVDQKLTVGREIRLKGEISNCDTLVVQGHIEATASTRCIEIADSGTFKGNAEIQKADISGHFEGNLTVADRLIIRSSGRVLGKIRYNSIEIEAGGEISGDIQVTHEAEDAKTSDEIKETTENPKSDVKVTKDPEPKSPESKSPESKSPESKGPETKHSDTRNTDTKDHGAKTARAGR